MNRRLESAIADAKSDVAYQEKQLIMAAEAIARQMSNLVKNVQDGSTLNSLGELQSRGPGLDVQVATLAAARTHLATLLRLEAAEEGKDA